MSPEAHNLEQLRMMTKVAHLYHNRGLVQSDIAQLLGLSQARVSRLLAAAEEANIIRTVVVPPIGLNSELEEALEKKFGLVQVHVVDASGETDSQRADTLARALATVFELLPLNDKVIGFTSWSRSMRRFVAALNKFPHAKARAVVELVGGIGEPGLQHEATTATERLANLIDAQPMFLRVPGVVATTDVKRAILDSDSHARATLAAMDSLDIALVGIGNLAFRSERVSEGNFFSLSQFDMIQGKGAVGEVDLRFLDANGKPIASKLDELVIGVTLEQLKKAERRIGVAGGKDKHAPTLAAIRGGWINMLVTDQETAEFLLSQND
jgi:DNA-binding transcriptional regulator LsrR (DeoR family)